VQPRVHFLTYFVGFGPSDGHIVGLLLLPNSSLLNYHMMGGFEGTNAMDLDNCFFYYIGDDYPTFHLDSVDIYHKLNQKMLV
jgi:hypothetical protein